MNPFIADYATRLQAWKATRERIHCTPEVQDKITCALDFWRQAPEEHVRINWDDCTSWPAAWDLIHDNAYCAGCVSLGIAYTLQLADPDTFDHVTLKLLWDKAQSRQRIVVHTHDSYLNWGYVDNTPTSQVKTVLIQNTWEWRHKQWQSTRPK
jgi:hypothetical protein